MEKIVAGNWKMNTSLEEGIDLVQEILKKIKSNGVRVIIAPPFTHLAAVTGHLRNSPVLLAGQDCSAHNNGAHTGDISAAMLKSVGATAVIIGHSERRNDHQERNALLLEKLRRAVEAGLIPVYCVGETLEERSEGRQEMVVETQLIEGLFPLLKEFKGEVIIAYEPVWAIGTGKTATPAEAGAMHAFIRRLLVNKFGERGGGIPLLYGGSCNPSNASSLFSEKEINGGLIGGASLKAADFLSIIEQAAGQ